MFGHDGEILGSAQEIFTQHYPQPGWVEHDPEEIWHTQLHSARLALEKSGLAASDIAALGITNQRETCLLWDAETGRSLGNAICWQCRRTADRCTELREASLEPRVEGKTGLRLDPYFSATKLEWLMNKREGAAELLGQERLRAGTIDSFLIWRLTGGKRHLTDFTNASRTMLMNLESLDWDDELLELFHVPRSILPHPRPSSGHFAECRADWLGSPIPITGVAGDQQAALFGQGASSPGDCKNTYGTGCFVLMNAGPRPIRPGGGLLSTVAWVLETDVRQGADEGLAPTYALEGSIFTAGAAVQWLRDGLGIIETSAEIGPLAAQAPDNGGVYFVPALTGLGTPYWDPYARGLLVGLTRGTRREHIARATEEAICYQTRAVLEAMLEISGVDIPALRVDGGAAADDFLMHLQADLLGIPVYRSRFRETTALGTAALAGLAAGFWSRSDLETITGTEDVFRPSLEASHRDALYADWRRAVERALGWVR